MRITKRIELFAVLLTVSILPVRGVAPPVTILQYGFDFGRGTVTSNGGSVADDSGKNHPGFVLAGDGGAYREDIPPTNKVQNIVGIGSLDLSTGSLTTDRPGGSDSTGLPAFAEILQYGGLTLEAWVKGGNGSGIVLANAGIYLLQATETGVQFANGFDEFQENAEAVMDRSDWHHVAGVLTNPSRSGNGLLADLNLYVDGVLKATFSKANFLDDLPPAITVGNHPLFATGVDEPFTGLVFDPRVSLGPLAPEQFTIRLASSSGLTIRRDGELVVIEWQGDAILESAELVTGPFKPVQTSGNHELSFKPDGKQQFFQLH